MTTGQQVLAEARQRLLRAGIDGGDAMALLRHAQGDSSDLTQPLPPDVAARFDAALAARLTHQPVAQIRGWRDFWNHRFIVTRDVLDPRPETETLVAHALTQPFATVLDLGTGSGAILLSLLADRAGATGTGTDLSPAALGVAIRNAAALGITRAVFLQSDWFAGVTGQFDLIVSNPPYIAAAEMSALSPDVRDWEPHMALTPGGDGLDAYRAIASGALRHLVPGGALMVEIGPTQGAAVRGLFGAAGLLQVAVLPDLDGRDRVVTGRCPPVRGAHAA